MINKIKEEIEKMKVNKPVMDKPSYEYLIGFLERSLEWAEELEDSLKSELHKLFDTDSSGEYGVIYEEIERQFQGKGK